MAHLMGRIWSLARRIAQRDAAYRASDATKSKGQILPTEGRLSLGFGLRCDPLMVPRHHVENRA